MYNRDTREAYACKIVETQERPELVKIVRKELFLFKKCRHKNICRYEGFRQQVRPLLRSNELLSRLCCFFFSQTDPNLPSACFIFMEYLTGGELFDKIKPGEGLPAPLARDYYSQLLDGVSYLHSIGIVHRCAC